VANCGTGSNATCFSNPLLFNNIFWDNRAGTKGPRQTCHGRQNQGVPAVTFCSLIRHVAIHLLYQYTGGMRP
jgi:hypothetical protein